MANTKVYTILLGIFISTIAMYALYPSKNTRNIFIGSAALAFGYCSYSKISEMLMKSTTEPVLISGVHSGRKKMSISSSKFKMSDKEYEYSISFWFKISNWNYRYGSHKVFLNKNNSPKIYLDNFHPTLIINQAVYDPSQESVGKTERIIVGNVPIQKWVHFFMIIRNKRVSVFLDGKLVKGYVLTHMPWIQKGKMMVAPGLGFDGVIAHLKYYNKGATYDDVSWEYNINKPK